MSPFDPMPETETVPTLEYWQAATMYGEPISVDYEARTALVHTRLHRGKPDLVFEVRDPEVLRFLGSRIGEATVFEGMGLYQMGADGGLLAGKVGEARPGPGPFPAFDKMPKSNLHIPAEVWAEIWRNVEEDERDGE